MLSLTCALGAGACTWFDHYPYTHPLTSLHIWIGAHLSLAVWEPTIYTVTILLLTAALVMFMVAIVSALVLNPQWPFGLRKCGVVLVTLAAIFWVCEIACMFIPRSHGSGYAFSHLIWTTYYWRPVNKQGYRDEPWAEQADKRLVVLGDSYAAGHGIKDYRDRFPDILRRRLPAGWAVYNISAPGADTRTELRRLKNFPWKPDVMILQYLGNDIEPVAMAHDYRFDYTPYTDVNPMIARIVQSSYFANMIYWRLPHVEYAGYWEVLRAAYADPVIRKAHFDDLAAICAIAKDNNIPLLVVMCPFVSDVELSYPYMRDVSKFLAQQGVPVLDVSDAARKAGVSSLMVNAQDQHPNEAVHAAIAQNIEAWLLRQAR